MKRRDFLKAMMISGISCAGIPADLFASDQQIISHASHFGPFYAHTRNGRIVRIDARNDDISPVTMLQALKDQLESPARVRYPCVRKSFLDGKLKPELRGAEPFVRVSWNTALDLIAGQLDETKTQFGNEAIFRVSFAGWSHPGLTGRPNLLLGRFLGQFGGYSDTIGDFSTGAAQRIMPHVTGSSEVYNRQTSYHSIEKNTRLFVLWGSDPIKTKYVDYNVPDHSIQWWIKRYHDQGMKFICIDPLYNITAREVKAEWVPIRPGTDVALMLAICYVLYQEKLYDADFLERYTVGFNEFLEYLLGHHDKQPKTPTWAAAICNVPEKVIVQLARQFAEQRTLLAAGWGSQRMDHGEQVHWMLMVLASMLGQIGLPGGGCNLGLNFSGSSSPSSGIDMPQRIPQGRNPVRTVVPASRMGEMLLHPGKAIDFNGTRLIYPEAQLLYCSGVNFLGQQQHVNELVSALRKRTSTLICHEPWWTATAKFSDIVLPATVSLERNDIAFGGSFNRNRIWALKKVIPNRFEARDDYDIFSSLAARLGFKERFTLNRDQLDWVRWSYAQSGSQVPFEDFWEEGVVRFPIPEENQQYVRHEAFRKDPDRRPLCTPSGKIEIYSEKVFSFGYTGCPGHPVWLEPKEWLGSKKTQQYPFHLISPHPQHRLHSQLDYADLRKTYKVKEREPVLIHPLDAAKLSIQTGDLVEVYNDRGCIVCGAVLTEDIVRQTVCVEEGAWYCPESTAVSGSRCLSGNVNVLTSSRPTSELSQATTANSSLVALRKISEAPPHNAYHPPDISSN